MIDTFIIIIIMGSFFHILGILLYDGALYMVYYAV